MNIMILGAGVMQIPAIESAKNKGWKVLAVDGDHNAPGKELADFFYPIDLKDRVGLAETAAEFHNTHGLNGVFTAGTDFSSSVAWVAEKIGLPGISFRTALNATDKIRMRTAFLEHNVPSPLFVEFSDGLDIESSIDGMLFPLVVKPVDNMGARGVVKVEHIDDLETSLAMAIEFSRTGRAVIEEFLDGPEFSLDALVHEGEVSVFGFADRHICFPPYFVEMGHTIPSSVDESIKKEVIEVFTAGVKALGITSGAAKGDMKYTSRGAVVGEIAARLSGGYMSGWTYPYSSGINLTQAGLELAAGLPLQITADMAENRVCAERAYISIPGVVKEVSLPDWENREEVKNLFSYVAPGKEVCFPVNNVQKAGSVIAAADTREEAVKAAEETAAEVVIRLEEENRETEEFLFHPKSFPPPAFDINCKSFEKLSEDIEYEEGVFYVASLEEILMSEEKDWQGRTVQDVLRLLTPYIKLKFIPGHDCGKEFYTALIRGSVQGVLYYFDTLKI